LVHRARGLRCHSSLLLSPSSLLRRTPCPAAWATRLSSVRRNALTFLADVLAFGLRTTSGRYGRAVPSTAMFHVKRPAPVAPMQRMGHLGAADPVRDLAAARRFLRRLLTTRASALLQTVSGWLLRRLGLPPVGLSTGWPLAFRTHRTRCRRLRAGHMDGERRFSGCQSGLSTCLAGLHR
jgi:hypothetical protein